HLFSNPLDRPVLGIGHDLDGGVLYFFEKTVDHRTVQQVMPSRPRRLPEDDVRDALFPREVDQRVSDIRGLEPDHLGAQVLREADVVEELAMCRGIHARQSLSWRLNVNREPSAVYL